MEGTCDASDAPHDAHAQLLPGDAYAQLLPHDAYAQLSPRSRRKRKNRDQMRLARQKEKETMLQLRETVARLEVAYARESEAADARGSSEPPAAARESATAARYAALVATSSRLKEENFRLKQALHDKRKTQEALERVFGDYWQTAPASPSTLRDMLHDPDGRATARDAYTAMTDDESRALIRETHARIRWVQQSFARRAQEPQAQQPSYCGWAIRYHTQDGALLFAFEKSFHHITALRAMEQMWACELEMKSYRSFLQAAHQTLEIVQHVNKDTYVFQRRLLDPLTHRSVTTPYIRFRLKTARGHLLCTKTLEDRNSSDPAAAADDDDDGTDRTSTVAATSAGTQQEEKVKSASWATRMCAWTEFEQEGATSNAPFGRGCCVARHTGYTNLQRGELNRSVVADMIMQLLRWENAVIGPVFTLSSA